MSLWLGIKALEFQYPGNRDFLLDIQSISYRFERPLGIYGNSGSGKSTLGKLISRLLLPSGGEICLRVDGGNNRVNLRTIYCSQLPERMFLGSSVGRVVNLIQLESYNDDNFKGNLITTLEQLSMNYNEIENRFGYEMSDGELRKFAISVAICSSPDLLILDEPTIGLDEEDRSKLYSVLHDFIEKRALIIISNNFGVIDDICQHIWVLDCGKIVYDGEVSHFNYSDYVGLNAIEQFKSRSYGDI